MQENNPVSAPIVTPPIVVEQSKQPNFLIILLSVLLLLSVSIAGFFAFQTQKLVKELTTLKTGENVVTEATTKPSDDSGLEPEKIPLEMLTKDWKIYSDGMLTFKYPSDVLLNQNQKGTDKLGIQIRIKDLNNYTDEPMGFDIKTALSDQNLLNNNKYGQTFGNNFFGSQKIVKLDGKIPAKSYISLQETEVCNVRFVRGLIFFKDDKQVIFSLSAPYSYTTQLTNYFTLDSDNCGDFPVWKSTENFYNDLVANKAPKIAQEWYDLFDQIVSTFEFTN